MKKSGKIIAAAVSALMVAVSGAAAVLYSRSQRTAEVTSVSMLAGGFWDPMTSSGIVYDAGSQKIYPDSTKTVTQVFVSEGQQVKAGDALLAYDTGNLALSLAVKQLAVDAAKNDLEAARHRLQKLQNTAPTAESTAAPEPDPSPEPSVPPEKPEKQKTEDAWNYVDSASDIWMDEPEENADLLPDGNSVSETEVQEEPEEEPEDGDDFLHPMRFILTEDGKIYGSLFNELRGNITEERDTVWISFEVHEENREEKQCISSWLVSLKHIPSCQDDDCWEIMTRRQISEETETPEKNPEETPESVSEPVQQGYTAEELAREIRNQQKTVRDLDLDVRRKELELRMEQESATDGVVYAKHDGVVTVLHDPSAPPQDGTPLLTVSGSAGTYIQGQISELLLDRVQKGDPVTVMSWNTGSSYQAEILSVDTFPASDGYSGGNPNASMYPVYAYIPEQTDLSAGDGLELNFLQEGTSDAIWLDMAYVRRDSSGYYVMKDDGSGKLVRQTVSVGRISYGSMAEIRSGLSMSDQIAFPYGKNAAEGIRTSGTEAEEGGIAE